MGILALMWLLITVGTAMISGLAFLLVQLLEAVFKVIACIVAALMCSVIGLDYSYREPDMNSPEYLDELMLELRMREIFRQLRLDTFVGEDELQENLPNLADGVVIIDA